MPHYRFEAGGEGMGSSLQLEGKFEYTAIVGLLNPQIIHDEGVVDQTSNIYGGFLSRSCTVNFTHVSMVSK